MTSVLFMAGIGLVAALVLVVASRLYSVPVDSRIEQVAEALPGINCGACGYSSCAAAAEAVVKGDADSQVCLVGGEEVQKQVAVVMGSETIGNGAKKRIAFLMCSRNVTDAGTLFNYNGPQRCRSAVLLYGGGKKCSGGCIGFGDCVAVCPVDAISLKNGLPVIADKRCTGCGLCVAECPKNIIALVTNTSAVIEKKRCAEYCKKEDLHFRVDQEHCIKCGICFKNCPSGAITWKKGESAFINIEKCTQCLTCLRLCPPKVIS